jgi:hypothetical protein
MRHPRLTTRGGVMDAQCLAAFVNAVQAIGRPDAGADAVFGTGAHLGHDMRVRQMGAGHADHVQFARSNGMARGCHIGDARRVEDRELRGRPHLAREVQMRRRPHALDRNDRGQGRVAVDMAPDQVEKIDLAAGGQAAGNLHPFGFRQTPVPVFIGHQPQADDERGPDQGADRIQHPVGKAQTVVQRPAIGIRAAVGCGRPEAIHEMAVGFEFDPVQPGGLHPLRCCGIVGDDPVQVPVLGLFRKGAMCGFAHRRRGQHRQPVAFVPPRAPAQMGQLDHHRRAFFVAGVGKFGQPGQDGIIPGVQIAKGCGLSRLTTAEPAVIVRATPPRAFS